MNKNGRRLAAKERIEHKGSKSLPAEKGQRWSTERVNAGKGGQKVGKRTGFSHFAPGISHLYPPDSMQVVDFPRTCNVSIFWGEAGNSRISGRGMAKQSLEPIWGRANDGETETQREPGLGTGMGKGGWEYWRRRPQEAARAMEECRFARKKLRIVTGKFAKFHEVTGKFAQIRPVNPRLFGFLRVSAFFGESTIGPPPLHMNRRSTCGGGR
jgi:hypothetical protein